MTQTTELPKDWPTYLAMHTTVCHERDRLLEALKQLVYFVAPTIPAESRLSQGLSSALINDRSAIKVIE